jgi:hypothetical protein
MLLHFLGSSLADARTIRNIIDKIANALYAIFIIKIMNYKIKQSFKQYVGGENSISIYIITTDYRLRRLYIVTRAG